MDEILKELQELKDLMIAGREAFNSKQAANYLSISTYSLLRYARIGDIEYVKNGSSYIFRKRHLDDWLDKQERRTRNGLGQ